MLFGKNKRDGKTPRWNDEVGRENPNTGSEKSHQQITQKTRPEEAKVSGPTAGSWRTQLDPRTCRTVLPPKT